ncbi:MAG: RidA family protein [Nanoarchaeota archaeon]|nr:RidA family protein [Nanoarchaeota archaeon]
MEEEFKYHIHTENAPPPGAYSQAVAVRHGNFWEVTTSGICGEFPVSAGENAGEAVEGGTAAETTKALENIVAIFESIGGSIRDLTKMTVYLADGSDDSFNAYAEAYAAVFKGVDKLPVRVTVTAKPPVARLVEIRAVGHIALDDFKVSPNYEDMA